jgi:hypothetical protein
MSISSFAQVLAAATASVPAALCMASLGMASRPWVTVTTVCLTPQRTVAMPTMPRVVAPVRTVRRPRACVISPNPVAARGNEPVATSTSNSQAIAWRVKTDSCKFRAHLVQQIHGIGFAAAALEGLSILWESAFSHHHAAAKVSGPAARYIASMLPVPSPASVRTI